MTNSNIESRILKAARAHDTILVKLCKQWVPQTRKGGKPVIDPVTCVWNLRTRKIAVLIMAVLFIMGGTLLMLGWAAMGGFNTTNIRDVKYCSIMIGILIPILFVSTYWPEWKSLNHLRSDEGNWEIANAMAFIKAIETIEESMKSPFTDRGNDNLSGIVELEKNELRDEARAINNLRDIPWRQKDAEIRFEAWKERHALMRRLFPDLPEDYAEYFPKSEKPETRVPASVVFVNP